MAVMIGGHNVRCFLEGPVGSRKVPQAVDLLQMEAKRSELVAQRDEMSQTALGRIRHRRALADLAVDIHDLDWAISTGREHVSLNPTSSELYRDLTRVQQESRASLPTSPGRQEVSGAAPARAPVAAVPDSQPLAPKPPPTRENPTFDRAAFLKRIRNERTNERARGREEDDD